jgi:toxin ParE1/3/4
MIGHRRPLFWSPEARADLSDIWNYYSRVAGRHTANNVVRRIGEACQLLEDHPYAGRARNEVRPGLRSVTANPHIVFYRVTGDDVAEIVRIIDGRRDIDEIFAGSNEA